ncbi:MAG: DMT family transporter [Pseudomonadales bacterium]|nr:DMT family transporter [Pseudomonadales bacterium]
MNRLAIDKGENVMSVLSAYVGVILIWSTTPLAIHLSNESFSPIASATFRMWLALLFAVFLALILRRSGFALRQNWKVYVAASVGIFPNMPLVYWAANFIPSGLISVLFGLSPLVTGLAARYILDERNFTFRKLFALIVAFGGLLFIFFEQIGLGDKGVFGVALMIVSTVLFSVSSVYVKHFGEHLRIDPLHQTTGALLFATPGLSLCWFLLDGKVPVNPSPVSVGAVLYLAVVGSVLGFGAYFYILKRLSVGAVSLIPLVTPGLALILGNLVVDESITRSTIIGTLLIVSGLAIYDASVLAFVLKKCNLLYRAIRTL